MRTKLQTFMKKKLFDSFYISQTREMATLPLITFCSFLTIFVLLIEKSDSLPLDEGNDESEKAKKVEKFENITQSPRDPRSYRGLKLSNELSFILISDQETDKAAACMTVGVGSMHDFDELPGIAHFLEHMLFLGSEKYREENHFAKFIQEHSGTQNGSTNLGKQSYHWDIAHEHLEEALDIFAQFFLKPLMDPSCTSREVKAVDSEFSLNLSKDNRRIYRLQSSLSKPNHSYGHFASGNLKSLDTDPKARGIDVRKKLLELYEAEYSSNRMYLAVLGKESLDDLEKMVVPLFEKIYNKNLQKSIYSEQPWGPAELMRKVHILTIADVRILMLRFPMPDSMKYYKAMPLLYISTLIGHEGPGSIISELRERRWGESLLAGFDNVPGFTFFYIKIDITKEAMDLIDDIIKLVFQYVYLLKEEKPQKRIFEEIKEIRKTMFDYAPKSLPVDSVRAVSDSMMNHPFEDVLSFEYLMNQWNPSLIQDFLFHIRPENMNVYIGNRIFDESEGETHTEPWYGVKYKIEEISDEFIDKMWKITERSDKFHLPPPNEFIAKNFELYSLPANESINPRIIYESSISQFWFKQDDEFKLPQLNIHLNLYSPLACLNQQNENLSNLFLSLFNENFVSIGYSATLAGLNWNIKLGPCRIEIELLGYVEKLPHLLQHLITRMINFKPNAEKFEIKKETLVRSLENFETDQPFDHGDFYLTCLVTPSCKLHRENLIIAKNLKMDDMKKFQKKLFSRIFVQGLIYGNCDKELALHIVSIVEKSFESTSSVLPQELVFTRSLELQEGSNFIYTSPHNHSINSSYQGYFQTGHDYPLRNIILGGFFDTVVSEKCYKVLRTEEQLGYIVHCRFHRKNSVLSFIVRIQSKKHPAYVGSRVEAFLLNLHQFLVNMADEEVRKFKIRLKNIFSEKKTSQEQKSRFYWTEISDRRYLFDRSEVMVSLVDSLKKKDLLDLYEKFIYKPSTRRRKLGVYIVSTVTNPEIPDNVLVKDTKIDDIVHFRSSLSAFPQETPMIQISPLGTKVKPRL